MGITGGQVLREMPARPCPPPSCGAGSRSRFKHTFLTFKRSVEAKVSAVRSQLELQAQELLGYGVSPMNCALLSSPRS